MWPPLLGNLTATLLNEGGSIQDLYLDRDCCCMGVSVSRISCFGDGGYI